MIALLLSPIGRWLGGAAIVLALFGGVYLKGRSDGKALIQARWDRAEQIMLERGRSARDDAEAEIPALGPVPIPPERPCVMRDRYDRDCG